MLIGIVGAPNKGKSTLFSALTMNEVEMADYPFTTINPNLGVAYATRECAEKSLKTKCRARNSLCINGTRMIPVNLVDVAGLVEGAHLGKGMGNQFLNDLAAADALILVVDASGKTDTAGNHAESDPVEDVNMVRSELGDWLAGIIARHMSSIARRKDGVVALSEVLAGLKIGKDEVSAAIDAAFLTSSNINWSEKDARRFADELLERTKPIMIVANKSDIPESQRNVERLREKFGNENVIECSAAIELALRKAAKQGIIEYVPGQREFRMLKQDIPDEQRKALEYMLRFLKERGTNVQEVINGIVFDLLDNIVVYPVEDENKYTDHSGNVLPDAILLKRGSTATDLAAAIHTDLAKSMLYALNARTKMRLGKEYELKEDDVVRIVSAARPN